MSVLLKSLIATLLSTFMVVAHSAEVQYLSNMPLPSIDDNHEMLMITVSYAPGESSMPHRHNAHTFVYVLEGAVEMQVAGGEPVILQAGQTFYELPDDVHEISRNASDTHPARILVFFIKPIGAPATLPVAH
jgi:quercetin dioxygenase-like cupin family protein